MPTSVEMFLQAKGCVQCGGCGSWITQPNGPDGHVYVADSVVTDDEGRLKLTGPRHLITSDELVNPPYVCGQNPESCVLPKIRSTLERVS